MINKKLIDKVIGKNTSEVSKTSKQSSKKNSKKQEVVFFHIGDTFIAFKAFARLNGFKAFVAPKPNNESVSIGVNVSPEFACFPFKVFIGSYIQAVKAGAKLIFAHSNESIVACQYADFAHAQKQILKKYKYHADMVIFEKFSPGEVLAKLKHYNPDLNLKRVTESLIVFSQKVHLTQEVDLFYAKLYISKGKKIADLFKKKWLKTIDKTDSMLDLYTLTPKIKADFEKYPKFDYDKLIKVAIIGDIYSINVEHINNNLFERLLDQKIYCTKGHQFGDLIDGAVSLKLIEEDHIKKARKYLKHNVGGLAHSTIGQAIKFAEEGYDGLIHIYPFTCMPETVVRSILPKIGKDFNIPILFLPIDEQTGDAGFATRIDAFSDLLKMRKDKKLKEFALNQSNSDSKNSKEKTGKKNEIFPWN